MQTDLRQNNIITITGQIVSDYIFSHEIYGEQFYNFSIKADRLSQATDIIPITISERLINNNIHMGVYVRIFGQIRTYNSYDEQKNRLILTVFAKDIAVIDESDKTENPNQVQLNGFICKKPIYRTTPFGREITDILLAVNRTYNKSAYIPCIAWGRNARYVGRLNVGDNLKITGRLQSRDYQKKLDNGDVLEKTAYEVSVTNLLLVENEE